MSLDRKNMLKIAALIAFAVILFAAVQNPGVVGGMVQNTYKLLAPFLLGGGLAFILHVPLRSIEGRLFAPLERKHPVWGKLKRPFSLLLSIIAVAGVIMLLMLLIVPQIKAAIIAIGEQLPVFVDSLYKQIMALAARWSLSPEALQWFDLKPTQMTGSLLSFFGQTGTHLAGMTYGIATGVITSSVNVILGLFIAIYILLDKEKLSRQGKAILYAVLPKRTAEKSLELLAITEDIFSRFLVGQVTEACIIGVLCYLGMRLFRMPYAVMISALVGFTSLIPIIGAILGLVVGGFLILIVNPLQAFWFVVFILVLQQLEGNLIYPKVVGKSVGLPALWVLTAVFIGASMGDLVSLVISVPVCSVLYVLLGRFVRNRLAQKER